MDTVFLICAIAGGAVLALQIILGLLGFDTDADVDAGQGVHLADDALNLLSVRTVSAGLLFFGITGVALENAWIAVPLGSLVGVAAAVGVAFAMRALMRLESHSDSSLYHAVGQSGSVYLSIPPGRDGRGKVHLTLDGRTLECEAVSDEALPTGASVLVIDVVGPDLVEVVPSPQLDLADP